MSRIATPPSALQKPLLLGLAGALGCLLAWPVGEAFVRFTEPQENRAQAKPAMLFSPEMARRLEAAGAQTGDVQLSLLWANTNDLDLHCVDPQGTEISYQARRAPSGGELDVDRNASLPLTDTPVENIYWPTGQAPLGNYRIWVNHFANRGGADPTRFTCEMKIRGEVKRFEGQLLPKDNSPSHSFELTPPMPPPEPNPWHAVLMIAIWTAIIGIGLSLSLVIGQNAYLRRPLLSMGQFGIAVGGAAVAGLVAGAGGQLLFQWAVAQEGWTYLARLAGWALLGTLLGSGMAYFIPNLSGRRAAFAGGAGGALGAMVFAGTIASAGAAGGRLLGMLVLGVAIGLMVALVESVYREGWLEISYNGKETRTVSLGAEPVSIGGDAAQSVVFARGAAPVALRYRMEAGRILCEDTTIGKSVAVSPGEQRQVGNLTITARAAGKASVSAVASPGNTLVLRLTTGASLGLMAGARFTYGQIPGLISSAGPVAEVTAHPSDPSILGLTNRSTVTWSVALTKGDTRRVPPGKSVRLTRGTRIDFGSTSGEIIDARLP